MHSDARAEAKVMDSDKLNVQCTYSWCSKWFDTEKEMKNHKKYDPEHFYCKKCDVDCEDWEALTQHKVQAMEPWLEGRMKHNKDESPVHIVCEFCGEDFKSFGGRKLHRQQNHQAKQDVVCPKCSSHFESAGSLIAHFENDYCSQISSRVYHNYVQQKYIVKEIMKDPGEFQEKLGANKAFALLSDTPGLIDDDDEGDRDGGVTLLDQEDSAQMGGYKPLRAEVDLIDTKVPLTRTNLETWPRMPGQTASQLSGSMRSLSITSPAPSVSGTEVSASEYASSITSRGGVKHVYTESYPSLKSSFKSASVVDDDGVSVASATTTGTARRPGAWSTGYTSRALFKDAKPTPVPGEWKVILEQREQEALANDSKNIFNSRFWDMTSKDYDPDMFLNLVTLQYCCPFPGCDAFYDASTDLGNHLLFSHTRRNFRCTQCLKIFQKASSLISHAESAGGRCRVKETTKFDILLDEVSGGFLKAKHLPVPKVVKPEKAIVKSAEPMNGLMHTRYTAKMPHER